MRERTLAPALAMAWKSVQATRSAPAPIRGPGSRLVAEAAQILGIGELLGGKPKELSGGQRQRVALGRAIVRKPSVFLFDEPLSNLDAKLRAHMRTELALLHERLGKTTIYVTHDRVEALALSDMIAVMRSGRIIELGTPEKIYFDADDRFVADFIGSVNTFEAWLL